MDGCSGCESFWICRLGTSSPSYNCEFYDDETGARRNCGHFRTLPHRVSGVQQLGVSPPLHTLSTPCPLYPATFATVGCECLSISSTISLVFRVTSPLLYDACVSGLGDRCCLGRPPLPSQLTVLLLAYSTRTPPNFDAQTTDSCIGHCQGKSIQTSSKHLGERFPIWMVACCLDSLCVGEDHAGVSWFPARLVNGSRENSGMFALHLSPDFRHCVNEEFKPTLTTMPLLSRLCILTARGTL